MKQNKTIILLAMLTSLQLSAQIPKEFKLASIFQQDSVQLGDYTYKINRKQDWEVVIDKNSLKVIKHETKSKIGTSFPPLYTGETWMHVGGNATSVKVFNGWIVGLDAGEWGGDLRWYSSKSNRIDTIYGMVHQIEKYNNKLFALSGMLHMGISVGKLLEIKYDNIKNIWYVDTFYECDGYPFVFTRINSDFYILTNSDLIKIDKNKNVHYIIRNGFWSLAYPNSMKYYKGSIYIGMRGGVLKVTDCDKKITKEWFENEQSLY